ncbi:MAG: S-layer homology domain-containing protein, partial [bacterium]
QGDTVNRLDFLYKPEFTPAAVTELEEAVSAALTVVQPGMDDLAKALVLHDYLCQNVAYDDENYQNDTVPTQSYTAYGALVRGKAVCEGYARAYSLLLSRCGIPNRIVSSTTMYHTWNQIQLEGSWYHVDVTWDDPVPDTPGSARHTFFLLSDTGIADAERRHENWTGGETCSDTRYDSGAFWSATDAPIPFTDGNTCWTVAGEGSYKEARIRLIRRDWRTGATSPAASASAYWPVWGGTNSYWLGYYSGLVQWDNRLLFNDTTHIFAYDPAEESLETVYTYAGGEGHLYGLASYGEEVYYLLKRDPNREGTLYPCALTRKYPYNPFRDVYTGDYFAPAVLWAVENGVTQGTSASTFSPSDTCTRAQVVTFLWRAMGCPAPASGENPFADVPAGSYYYDAVLWAVERGIVQGTAPDRFSPKDTCTYAHILTFLWRTMTGHERSAYGRWYDEPADWAASHRLTGDAVRPALSDPCPRADVVYFLWKELAEQA